MRRSIAKPGPRGARSVDDERALGQFHPTPATNVVFPDHHTLATIQAMIQNTHSAGGVVRNQNGEIALVKHDGWFWGFPKGHVDEGESMEDAARRETQEEVGITELDLKKAFEPYERVKAGDENKPDREMKTLHMFLFDTPQMEFVLTDPRHDEARWVAVAEVERLLSHPRDKEFFASIKDTLK
jgi:ADP-ribose pyrophosphatase YjhB (NUDIX family)